MNKSLDIINNSGAFVKGQSQFIKEVLREKVVDLGLPSGLKWAVCDIDITQKDRFCKTPFTYNKSFFSWGNIEGHNPQNNSFVEVYNWGTINAAEPWYDGQVYGDTKGNTLTNNIPVGVEFDPARANLGDQWRMPTDAEFTELIDNCIYIDADGTEVDNSKNDKRVTANGIIGIYLQSKNNGNRIFFSTSGYGIRTIWGGHGISGYYWTSVFNTSRRAHCLSFNDKGVFQGQVDDRYNGFAIRPVRN